MVKKAKLVLCDGSEFKGVSFGAERSAEGEVVFNTGMVGYPESLTDPSYKGQILVLTYPLIGNYGAPRRREWDASGIVKGFESERIQVSGLIVADYIDEYSHLSAASSLHEWLSEEDIPAISGIDTRQLTKILRQDGVMLGRMSQDGERGGSSIEDPNRRNLVAEVSCKEKKEYGDGNIRIVAVDCGMKANILRSFVRRGVTVERVPWDYDFMKEGWDGLFISNGPGDPKRCDALIDRVGEAFELGKPVFGICLGNQILSLAAGGDTYKLKYGHRGQNQPCLEKGSGRCFITSQNHGYAVKADSLPDAWEVRLTNGNDGTVEGIRHKEKPFFGVQFHPEASPGPTDTGFLFDSFIDAVRKCKNEKSTTTD